MKLYIAMIASVIAISACKKDEDSAADEAGGSAMGACEQLLADYCACEGVDEAACDAYTESVEGSNMDEDVCQSYIDQGVC